MPELDAGQHHLVDRGCHRRSSRSAGGSRRAARRRVSSPPATQRSARLLLQRVEVRRQLTGQRLGDDPARRLPDAGDLLERAGLGPLAQLGGSSNGLERLHRVAEGLDPVGAGAGALEEERHPAQGLDRVDRRLERLEPAATIRARTGGLTRPSQTRSPPTALAVTMASGRRGEQVAGAGAVGLDGLHDGLRHALGGGRQPRVGVGRSCCPRRPTPASRRRGSRRGAASGVGRADRLLEPAAGDARLDDDDLHPERLDLDPQGVAEGLHGVLRRVVVAPERKGHPAAHRAEVDDAAAAGGAHPGQHELAHPRQAEDVGLEHGPHLVHVDLLDRAVLAVAGVVDEGADGAVGRLDLGDGRRHRRVVGDVERRSRGRPGRRGRPGCRGGERWPTPCGPAASSSSATARPMPVEQPVTRTGSWSCCAIVEIRSLSDDLGQCADEAVDVVRRRVRREPDPHAAAVAEAQVA